MPILSNFPSGSDNGADTQQLLAELENKKGKSAVAEIVLTAAGWNELSQTVESPDVAANSIVYVTPLPAFYTAYANAGILCTEQAEGSLTFVAAQAPAEDIQVGLIIDEPREHAGIDTSDATAAAADIREGKTAYVNGELIEGTIKTVSQAYPFTTLDATLGIVTATANQTEGYVEAGKKSTSRQLATYPETTITPTAEEQVAVEAGFFLTGDIKVAGDINLVPENIKAGVTIFGVTGTYAG